MLCVLCVCVCVLGGVCVCVGRGVCVGKGMEDGESIAKLVNISIF